MKEVLLNMNKNYAYQLVKSFVDHPNSNFHHLVAKLSCSERTARRWIAGYRQEGKAFFQHGNHGRKPARALSEELKAKIVALYQSDKYLGTNMKHFHELLQREEDLPTFSLTTLRNVLKAANLISPKARRRTKRAWIAKQKILARPSLASPPQEALPGLALPLDPSPHPMRVRSKYAGELLFADASIHDWFGTGEKAALHAAIDDATGTVVGAWFTPQETLEGYYHVLEQILVNYGIPATIQTDGRSVFEFSAFKEHRVENDRHTQFGYACKYFGIHLQQTAIAQKQGKIERLWETLQSRLVGELQVAGIKEIKKANEFLVPYITAYNKKFAQPLTKNTPNAFELSPSCEQINLHLARLMPRTITTGNTILYYRTHYRTVDANGVQVNLRPGTRVQVIEAYDKTLFATCNSQIFALDAVPENYQESLELDFGAKKQVPKKHYIPPMEHCWRQDMFLKHCQKQPTYEYTFREMAESEQILIGNPF